ncbi:60S ribosomal protein L23a [Oopsacas minuta]|uniref:60S ribosomal protein L23a n=1 Tax=Oopsacas minuta TaxID=111878 RepID=A0AAV7K0T4_9METZ|nr:60S ribosomal protein L23a [Oopsacas minuta]
MPPKTTSKAPAKPKSAAQKAQETQSKKVTKTTKPAEKSKIDTTKIKKVSYKKGLSKSKQMKSALKAKKAVNKGVHGVKKRKIRTSIKFYRPKTQKPPRRPKYPRISSQGLKELKFDHYAVIKYPLTTETAMKKIEDNNTLVFIVDPKANKPGIKKAVKKLYKINPINVNTLMRPDGTKKAYVKLNQAEDGLEIANKIGII